MFLYYQARTIGPFFLQAYSIWPRPRDFKPAQKSIGTPKFYRGPMTSISFSIRFTIYRAKVVEIAIENRSKRMKKR